MKYSIVIPVCNCKDYLPHCLNTICNIDYTDYEVIISDNCSTDGTSEYLSSINNPHVRIVKTPERYEIAESWNYAIDYAIGDWVFGIGADDGVMPYFFKLLDLLTAYCDKKKLNIIKCSRSYFFWPIDKTVDPYHFDFYSTYNAESKIKICSTKKILKKAICNTNFFFDIPQMYTTSLFRRQIIMSAKKETGEIIHEGSTQDAYLGVLGYAYERKFVYCGIPFAWVGTSSAAHGFRDFKVKNILLDSDFLNFSYNLYKHIPCTTILLIGALKTAYKVFLNKKIKKRIGSLIKDEKKILKIIYNDLVEKQSYEFCKENFSTLLRIYNYSIDSNKENKISALLKEKSKIIKNKLINFLFCKINNFFANKKKKYVINFTLFKNEFMPIDELNEFIMQKWGTDINKCLEKICM